MSKQYWPKYIPDPFRISGPATNQPAIKDVYASKRQHSRTTPMPAAAALLLLPIKFYVGDLSRVNVLINESLDIARRISHQHCYSTLEHVKILPVGGLIQRQEGGLQS